jgi:hypothetical protein
VSYLLACSARPDAGRMTLDGVLAAESATVSCVLRNFDLLDLFTEGGTVAIQPSSVSILEVLSLRTPPNSGALQRCCIPCAVFTGDADLLRSLRHFGWIVLGGMTRISAKDSRFGMSLISWISACGWR